MQALNGRNLILAQIFHILRDTLAKLAAHPLIRIRLYNTHLHRTRQQRPQRSVIVVHRRVAYLLRLRTRLPVTVRLRLLNIMQPSVKVIQPFNRQIRPLPQTVVLLQSVYQYIIPPTRCVLNLQLRYLLCQPLQHRIPLLTLRLTEHLTLHRIHIYRLARVLPLPVRHRLCCRLHNQAQPVVQRVTVSPMNHSTSPILLTYVYARTYKIMLPLNSNPNLQRPFLAILRPSTMIEHHGYREFLHFLIF